MHRPYNHTHTQDNRRTHLTTHLLLAFDVAELLFELFHVWKLERFNEVEKTPELRGVVLQRGARH